MANDRYERDRRYESGRGQGDWPYSDDEMGGRFGDNRRGSSWGGAGGPGFYASERYGQAYRGASSEGRYGDTWGGRDRDRDSWTGGSGRYGYEEWNDRSGDRYGSGSSGSRGSGYGSSRYSGGGGYGDDYGGGGFAPGSSYGSSGGYGSYGRSSGGGYGRSSGSGSYGSGSSYGGSSYGGNQGHHRGFMERAGDEIASWFGDEDAERRREADHRGKGPRGYQRSDSRIEEDVNDRLTDDPMVDASSIEVSVSDCEVTLSGTVPSRQAKRRAEDCAEDVSGVRHVQNNLRVEQPTASSMSSSSGSSSSGSSTSSSGL